MTRFTKHDYESFQHNFRIVLAQKHFPYSLKSTTQDLTLRVSLKSHEQKEDFLLLFANKRNFIS